MAFCKNCQGELPEDSTLCPACGADNAQTEETAAAEVTAAEEQAEEVCEETAAEETEEAAEESEADSAEEQDEAPAKKFSGKRIIAALLAVVLVVSLVFLIVNKTGGSAEASILDRESYAGTVDQLTPDSATMTKVVASIGDDKLTNAEFQIYYWMQFYEMANMYGDYLTYLGLDTTRPFDEQDSGMPVNADVNYAEISSDANALATLTWEQYFIQMALECYEEYTALSEAAAAEGMEMPADYTAMLEAIPDDLAAQAEASGFATAEEFLQASFGTGVTVQNYVDYMQTYLMAATYAAEAQNVTDYTEADIEAYFDANAETYAASGIEKTDRNVVNVRHILIQPEMDLDSDEDGVADASSEEAWAAAEQTANDLYAQWNTDPTEEYFITLATENSADTGSLATGGLYEDIYPGQMVPEFNDWCFEESRQPADSAVVKTTYGFHIMYFVSEGDYVYWYMVAENDYKTQVYSERLDEIVAPVVADINYRNIYVNSLMDMVN